MDLPIDFVTMRMDHFFRKVDYNQEGLWMLFSKTNNEFKTVDGSEIFSCVPEIWIIKSLKIEIIEDKDIRIFITCEWKQNSE